MTEQSHRKNDVDPDYFDLIIQGLSALSSVASLGATWLAVRANKNRAENKGTNSAIEETLFQLSRSFEDVFRSVRAALRVLRDSYEAREGKSPDELSPRFGSAQVLLSPEEFANVQGPLGQLGNAANMLRSHANNMQMMLNHSRLPGEESIQFDLSQFNDDLNSILFDSKNFREAIERMNAVELRAEDFLRSARNAVRRN